MRPPPAGTIAPARSARSASVEDDVGAAARTDLRQLGLVTQFVRSQAVGPHTGRVDDVVSVHDDRLVAHTVAGADAGGSAALLDELLDREAVRAHRAEALRLPEHGEHEPHVVGLAVVEEVARGRRAAAERRQEREDLGAGDDAVAVRAPGVDRRGAPSAQALDRHDVVEVQPDADQAIEARAVEGRHDDGQRTHEVRGERHEQLALEQRLANQAKIEVLEVAQPAVDELARAARGARGVVGALEQGDAVAATGGVERHPGSRDPAADHGDIEALPGECFEGLCSRDHSMVDSTVGAAGWSGDRG